MRSYWNSRLILCETNLSHEDQELIVLNREGNKRTISLKTFFKVEGLITCQTKSASFKWKKDHGTITGNVAELLSIFHGSDNFKDYRLMTKRLYDYKKCNAELEKPCPYFYAGRVVNIGSNTFENPIFQKGLQN